MLTYIYNVNHLFIFLIIFISSISCSYQNDYSGVWESNGKTFENSLILEKIKGNKYSFSFNGWRKSYDHFTRDTTIFSGQMVGNSFKIIIEDKHAKYIDSKDKTTDGFRLYNERTQNIKLDTIKRTTGPYAGYYENKVEPSFYFKFCQTIFTFSNNPMFFKYFKIFY